MWAASTGVAVVAARAVRNDEEQRQVPLMGVLGAFVFAAQMINFTIPATGSSGHLGGGLLLAALLAGFARHYFLPFLASFSPASNPAFLAAAIRA